MLLNAAFLAQKQHIPINSHYIIIDSCQILEDMAGDVWFNVAIDPYMNVSWDKFLKPGIKPMMYYIRDKQTNHYTTDVISLNIFYLHTSWKWDRTQVMMTLVKSFPLTSLFKFFNFFLLYMYKLITSIWDVMLLTIWYL